MIFGATRQSPTLNGPAHLAAGLGHLEFGTFDLYRVNPPLIRIVAAIPVTIAGYEDDWSGFGDRVGHRPIFGMGEDFIRANGRRSIWLMTLARWACLPFCILGGLVCFLWGPDLFGRMAGIVACSLWCFSPMMLANGSLIAPDAHAAALGLAASYSFWRWLKQPTWIRAVVTGVVLGLAELAKTTMLLFYPLWPLIWIVYRLPIRTQISGHRWIREAGMLVLAMLIGVYVLNFGYLGEGTFSKLGEFRFVSQMFGGENIEPQMGGNRFIDSWLSEVPVPFPSNYVIGIDVQQRDFEDFGRPSYLRGRWRETGWWYYYAYAILVKVPLGTLGLMALSVAVCFTRFRSPIHWNDVMVLLIPPLAIFVLVSTKSGFTHHSRYILPCMPFLFVWLGQLFYTRGGVSLGVLSVLLLAWSIGSSLSVYPHSLSYFNELAGGPKNGPEHLLNSNIDWGQDLLYLEKWVEKNADGAPVYTAYYNLFNPFDLEIDGIEPWPFGNRRESENGVVAPGFYAVSVNLLYDYPWPVHEKGGRLFRIDKRPNAYLRSLEPVGGVGYSIRIFSAQQMQEAFDKATSPPLWEEVTLSPMRVFAQR